MITLNYIVENLRILPTFASVKYPLVYQLCVRALRELMREVKTSSPYVKTVILSVDENTYTAPYPNDYLYMIKLGLLSEDGRIYAFHKAENIALGREEKYCQCDEPDPCVEETPEATETTSRVPYCGICGCNIYGYWFYNIERKSGAHFGRLFGIGSSGRISYRPDDHFRRFQFESSIAQITHEIVLEYASNSIVDTSGQVMVHEYALEPIMAWVDWQYATMQQKSYGSIGTISQKKGSYLSALQGYRRDMANFSFQELKSAVRSGQVMTPKR